MSKSYFYQVRNTEPGELLLASGYKKGLTFRKELIYAGSFHKKTDTHDQEFDVDINKLRHWERYGNMMLSNGVKVPCPLKHADTPEATRARVLKYELGVNKKGKPALYGVLEFRDAEAAKLAATTDVSIHVPEKPIHDGYGRAYPYSIRHVALTDYPVIHGLEDFEAVTLSLDEPNKAKPKGKFPPKVDKGGAGDEFDESEEFDDFDDEEPEANEYAEQNRFVAEYLKSKKAQNSSVGLRADAIERLEKKKAKAEKEKQNEAAEKAAAAEVAPAEEEQSPPVEQPEDDFKNTPAAHTARTYLKSFHNKGIKASADPEIKSRRGNAAMAVVGGSVGLLEYKHGKHIAKTLGRFGARQVRKGGLRRLGRAVARSGVKQLTRRYALPIMGAALAAHGVYHAAKTVPKYAFNAVRPKKVKSHTLSLATELPVGFVPGLGELDKHGNLHGKRGRFTKKPDHLKSKKQLHRQLRSGRQVFRDTSREEQNNNPLSKVAHSLKHVSAALVSAPAAYYSSKLAVQEFKRGVRKAGGEYNTGGYKKHGPPMRKTTREEIRNKLAETGKYTKRGALANATSRAMRELPKIREASQKASNATRAARLAKLPLYRKVFRTLSRAKPQFAAAAALAATAAAAAHQATLHVSASRAHAEDIVRRKK